MRRPRCVRVALELHSISFPREDAFWVRRSVPLHYGLGTLIAIMQSSQTLAKARQRTRLPHESAAAAFATDSDSQDEAQGLGTKAWDFRSLREFVCAPCG